MLEIDSLVPAISSANGVPGYKFSKAPKNNR